MLAYYAHKLAGRGRQVVVLAERVHQLEILNTLLLKNHDVPANWIGFYTGRVKEQKARDAILANCRIVLATTRMLSLGTDVPSLSCLILASPAASVEQSVGRILRRKAGKRSVVVVDIVDDSYRMTRGWYRNREKEYKALKANITVKAS